MTGGGYAAATAGYVAAAAGYVAASAGKACRNRRRQSPIGSMPAAGQASWPRTL